MSDTSSAVVVGLLLFSGLTQLSTAADTLTNEKVLQMVEAKLPTNAIIGAIESASAVNFDTSPAAVIALKKAGAGERVIESMLDAARRLRVGVQAAVTVKVSDTSEDPVSLLRSFRTIYADAEKAKFFDSVGLTSAFAANPDFRELGIFIIEDQSAADTVLAVSYVFAWDFAYVLRHRKANVVLLSGKGSGPFSGAAGASSVAKELSRQLKDSRSPRRAGSSNSLSGVNIRADGPAQVNDFRVNRGDKLTYVRVPPGKFTMGCSPGDLECGDDEKPTHDVVLTREFWIGQTEVTQEAYEKLMHVNPSRVQCMSCPVESVSWEDARAYCAAAGMRLPTEAEWEYAARAGSTTARYGEIDRIAFHSGAAMAPVKQREPNAFGLCDMLGNIWEWVSDWHQDTYYTNSPAQDPPGPAVGQNRVLRGGSWDFGPKFLRASARSWNEPTSRNDFAGFRCAGQLP